MGVNRNRPHIHYLSTQPPHQYINTSIQSKHLYIYTSIHLYIQRPHTSIHYRHIAWNLEISPERSTQHTHIHTHNTHNIYTHIIVIYIITFKKNIYISQSVSQAGCEINIRILETERPFYVLRHIRVERERERFWRGKYKSSVLVFCLCTQRIRKIIVIITLKWIVTLDVIKYPLGDLREFL